MGTLYVIATPIGNLEDLTLRAVTTLSNADLILAEDTRVTRVLCERYNIRTPIKSYHQHSSLQKIDVIIDLIRQGKKLALVSDAGTPGINDPGGFLIASIVEELPDTKIIPIPGVNAATAALSVSGFPADAYTYLGFPPHKKGRQTFFRELGQIDNTVVFYESKHRISKALSELKTVANIGSRPIVVGRELTKQFESVYRGTVDDVIRLMGEHTLGEFVVVIGPRGRIKHTKDE